MSWSDEEYTLGRQPCRELKRGRGNIAAAPEVPNVHECYLGCGKTVTFCDNCCRDHHEGGYDSCLPGVNRQLAFLAADVLPLIRAVVEGFTYYPGHSDLDDEQPITVSITLGDYRRARRLLPELQK